MKCKVDKDLCIGCATCTILAANSFKMNDDNKAVEINPPGDDAEALKDAKDNCPVAAITIEE
ncbi:MAG: putative ferredoxin, 4Fe-4S [Candidatus Magasanikbacteria bacterium GW2011_GWC2_37_14]|uniref:Ferredoxin n=1 Tax=Candidatus Magasanikbacteria bacterium GW2011_GWC2_37_14 TaxID=1619046 RepID=A0A0G0GAC3_9BACT|nr:MAG: putative ferredoxin, 4Fe-4S [Candidatus Magasanikbacteria bacterium GW2011_GWC2_37_14]